MIHELNSIFEKENVKNAFHNHGYQLLQQSQSLIGDFSAISAWIFIRQKRAEALKKNFLMVYNICRLHSFQDINEKP